MGGTPRTSRGERLNRAQAAGENTIFTLTCSSKHQVNEHTRKNARFCCIMQHKTSHDPLENILPEVTVSVKANPRVFGGALVNVHVATEQIIKKIAVSANAGTMLQFKENQLMLCYTAHSGKLLISTWALNTNLLYKSPLAPDRWAEENSSYASVMFPIKVSEVMEPQVFLQPKQFSRRFK